MALALFSFSAIANPSAKPGEIVGADGDVMVAPLFDVEVKDPVAWVSIQGAAAKSLYDFLQVGKNGSTMRKGEHILCDVLLDMGFGNDQPVPAYGCYLEITPDGASRPGQP